jgi:hypothetical protein
MKQLQMKNLKMMSTRWTMQETLHWPDPRNTKKILEIIIAIKYDLDLLWLEI